MYPTDEFLCSVDLEEKNLNHIRMAQTVSDHRHDRPI